MYLVKNMSLAEVNTEDVWNGDHESDQMRKSKSLVITQQFAETFHNTGEDDGTKAPEKYVPATSRRAMTEKGRDYKLKIMKERRQKLHKRIQRSWNTIEELQLSERNMAPVKQELAQFNDVYKLFVNLHEELNPMLEDSERAADDEWFEDIDERVCTFKRKTHNWLRVAEDNQHSRCPSSRSKGSRSSGQSRSSGSSKSKGSKSSREKEIEERVKMAELLAEAEFLEQRQKVENEAEMLKVQQELAKAKARVAAYGQHNPTEDICDDVSIVQQNNIPAEKFKTTDGKNKMILLNPVKKVNDLGLNVSADTYLEDDMGTYDIDDGHIYTNTKGVRDKVERKSFGRKREEDQQTNVAEMMYKMMKQQSAPEIDIDVFSGDPLDFHYFMALFHEVVEKKIDDSRGRLTRLIKYTKGEAKDMIKNCIQLPAKIGYDNAKAMLYQQYGDPHRAIAAYRQQIKKWPSVKHGDAEGYRKFYNFQLKCETVTQMQTWNVLDTPEVMCMLLSKLPGGARDKWSRKVLLIRRNQKRDLELADFIKFVNDENMIVNNPVFSREAVEQYIEKKTNRHPRKVSAFGTGSNEDEKEDPQKVSNCIKCGDGHDLDNCEDFMSKGLKDRIKFLARKKYCFGCLQPMEKGHNAKTCTRRLSCRTCKGGHPTAMHGYVPKVKKEKSNQDQEHISNNFADMTVASKGNSNAIRMCIVPVKVYDSDKGREMMTYAMLDNCTQGSFISESLVKQVNLSGRKTTLNLKTLNSKKLETAIVIDGLKVSSANGKEDWIKLPKLYTRMQIPVERGEIATPGKIAKWDYLKVISEEITQSDDVQVDLLIGANCPKALDPLKVISSVGSGPYAYQARLGWCIVGPIVNMIENQSVGCHQIMAKDAASSRLASHHFAIESSVKDMSLEDMFQRMYQNDFNEAMRMKIGGFLENLEEVSNDDRKFIKTVEQGRSKSGGHYVVPLPFREDDLEMPNNRKQAMQRFMYLKRKFKRDPSFLDDYKGFMNNLLIKGYARRSDKSPNGKTWYIPHHGVYHPSKPGKIRVVFDCSAQFNGRSLNKELLTGPDLTNPLMGILTRFRHGRIAFMADIESMYYQVMVPEDQLSFIKFLWWEDHNIDSDPVDFVMCAHVFGGLSSASCANYALKRTANDNVEKFGFEASEVVRDNFYVDDLLKSVDDLEKAKTIVKNVISVCKSGGFHLIKFISNDNELLMSIPEEQRRTGVKNKDLCEELPVEKALGMQWNISEDYFSFKIKRNQKLLTKRTMLSIISSIY